MFCKVEIDKLWFAGYVGIFVYVMGIRFYLFIYLYIVNLVKFVLDIVMGQWKLEMS